MHDTTTAAAPGLLAGRRCWRCLQTFPDDAERGAAARDEFWLCDPCEATLLPSKKRAT